MASSKTGCPRSAPRSNTHAAIKARPKLVGCRLSSSLAWANIAIAAVVPCASALHVMTAHSSRHYSPAGAPAAAGPPRPLNPPTAAEAQEIAAAARLGTLPDLADTSDVLENQGEAPLVPKALADRAAELAAKAIDGIFPGLLKAGAPPAPAAAGSPAPAPGPAVAPPKPPREGPPRPPLCAVPPRELQAADAQMALPPFRPAGSVGEPKLAEDGATVWRLRDGGWAFQYDDMAARIGGDDVTSIAWPSERYAVRMDPDGISYHKGQTVIHRGVDGDLVYHQPTGTIHQEGDTVIYHWCQPNLVVYHTPSGLIYYDDEGMTYRGNGGLAHYARNGDLTYQGVGGVTSQSATGDVTHWTDAGAIYQHPDGSVTYTPVGEKESYPLAPDVLGEDPFPGPPLTVEQVLALAREAELPLGTEQAADAAVKAAAASNAAHTAETHAEDVRDAYEDAQRDLAEHQANLRPVSGVPAPAPYPASAPVPGMAPAPGPGGPVPAPGPSMTVSFPAPGGMVPMENPLANKVKQLKIAVEAADSLAKHASAHAADHMAGAAPSPGLAWGAHVGGASSASSSS
eukprot:TRINITY_DN121971_c0_g1_i1.p1 TRINITY_DN121971_c0_g1~~TRINITY_DN121971_c0_g1_i1.p1  ORF type:complete len:571 (-),score=64.59 TRINITY_DN121971_c0_g1_i1:17-1729(-)